MENLKAELVKIRRELHQYPELGFEEHRTSKFVEDYLKALGIETKRIAKTGIIGILKGDLEGEVIGIRADMDCLPIQEENNFDFKSKHDGKMHACGHDGHTSILLCTAKYLASHKDKVRGTVKFIFQPAEESVGGALPMIKEGVLENPKVTKMYALHLWSMIPVGKVGVKSGSIMGATCEVKIEIIGKGGHGALPQDSVDSIVIASSFISNVQTVVSRNINPLEAGVVSFGTISGGSVCNAIASKVELGGTIRAENAETRIQIKERVKAILHSTCDMFGATYKLNFNDGYSALINNDLVTEEVIRSSRKVLGQDCIQKYQTLAAEDFSFFAELVPSCYFFVGAGNAHKDCIYPHHHPRFNIDEDALEHGMKIFIDLVLK